MRRFGAVLLAFLVWAERPGAHDLPADVVVQTFVKPEGARLHLIVRVPMSAMGDVDYPTRGPGNVLDLARADQALRDASALWLLPGFPMYEDGEPLAKPRLLAARISLPSDRSFTSYESALAHVTGPPLAQDTQLEWNQGMLDALIEYDIRSDRSRFALHPAVARLAVHVVTVVRFLPPTGGVRAFEWTGDPGVVVFDPRWYQSAFRFVELGFAHILSGLDHLLFLVCLVIPVRKLRALIPVVTAFAVAHSITLIASALGMAPGVLWFPPLIEVLIAVSIVYMALENMLAARFDHRWVAAFAFGLVHGFGFSFGLRESLQFAGSHLLLALLSFNVGVELGQILVLLLVIPPLALLFRYAVSGRVATIVLSALVAHTAWHWVIDRVLTLGRFTFTKPEMDWTLAVTGADWLLVGVVATGALLGVKYLQSFLGDRTSQTARPQAPPGGADDIT